MEMFTSSFDDRLGFSSFFFSLEWERTIVRLGDLFDGWVGHISCAFTVSSSSRIGDFEVCFLCLDDDDIAEWSAFFLRLCDEWEYSESELTTESLESMDQMLGERRSRSTTRTDPLNWPPSWMNGESHATMTIFSSSPISTSPWSSMKICF